MEYGFNLVLHGSLNTDFDLIAIPWNRSLGKIDSMIEEFAKIAGGVVMHQSEEERNCFPHGRQSYVININRSGKHNNYIDAKWYFDISVFPGNPKCAMCNTDIAHGEQICLDCFGVTEILID